MSNPLFHPQRPRLTSPAAWRSSSKIACCSRRPSLWPREGLLGGPGGTRRDAPRPRNLKANPGRFPAAGQRLPAPGSAILDVGMPPNPAPLSLVGCQAMVGRTNQEPESCRPQKQTGNVRGWAHRWTRKAVLGHQGGGTESSSSRRGQEAGKGSMGRSKGYCLLWGRRKGGRSFSLIIFFGKRTYILYAKILT